MNGRLQSYLQRSFHATRRRMALIRHSPPLRLVVQKTEWLYDKQSPVMLMIDDLTNAWHNKAPVDHWEPGGDWGGGLNRPGSAYRFLEDNVLRQFPEVKVTVFAIAGPLSAYTQHQPFSHAAPLDHSDESKTFFKSLFSDPRFDLAYHGYDHGTPGLRSEDFVQEWVGFASREAAVAQTRKGLNIFHNVTGTMPRGGKYGGWAYNDFSDQVVNDCGFLWWCRDWTPRDTTNRLPTQYYQPQFFGDNLVVALPSTVHGHYWERRQIDLLLSHRQVISIAEHIAPLRPDGRIQTPNVVDDVASLRGLFRYLRRKKVWYATGSEIASYIIARDRSVIYDVTSDGFSVRYDGQVSRPPLTLRIDGSVICSPAKPLIQIAAPDDTLLDQSVCRFDAKRYRHLVTLPTIDGRYRVWPVAA